MSDMNKDFLRVAVLGLRGLPEVQGGVERHCQQLYPLLAQAGHSITVLGRRPYIAATLYKFQGVTIIPLWSPKKKSLETIAHTAFGIFWVWLHRKDFDLLHIHAIGPALLTTLARLTGLKVVVTNHGPDYDRQKWGAFAKWMLRMGERMGARYAHRMIAVSQTIRDLMREKYDIHAQYIPNGVCIPEAVPGGSVLKKFELTQGGYILAVGRLVPEKGFHDLINAFTLLETAWKLVIVGDADHEDTYSLALKNQAAQTKGVVMTGFQKGVALGELYSNAGLFVLPSYHEGLPIVGLEAMSYELPMLLSDIPANCEIAEPQELFPVGNIEALSAKITAFLVAPETLSNPDIKARKRQRLDQEFNWEHIAKQTAQVYAEVAT